MARKKSSAARSHSYSQVKRKDTRQHMDGGDKRPSHSLAVGGSEVDTLPKSWPATVTFLKKCIYQPAHLNRQLTQWPLYTSVETQQTTQGIINRASTQVRIRSLVDLGLTTHPAYPQSGLFAARDLPPRQLVLEYRGVVTTRDMASQTSDYVLGFGDDLAIDAEQCGEYRCEVARVLTLTCSQCVGNEARFINDYRGVAPRPNVEFREFIIGPLPESAIAKSSDDTSSEDSKKPLVYTVPAHCVRMGVWTLDRPVKRGQELLVSYGKGYWRERGLLRNAAP
jgi:hypothetical protein